MKSKLVLNDNLQRFMYFLFFYFFFTTVIVSFSGGLQAITYRSFLYLLMGVVLGHLSNYKISRRKNLVKKNTYD